MEIDLSNQELQDGQLLVIYIMLRTFTDINLYKIVLFYMVLESYIFDKGEDEITFDVRDIIKYLNLDLEQFNEYIDKLVEYGWFINENGFIHVDYMTIYKLNQEIVSEKERKDMGKMDVEAILAQNKKDNVSMLLDRYWE